MRWKIIDGEWRWPYRVSDQGKVQKQLPNGDWQTIKPYHFGGGQMKVWMWLRDGKRIRIEVSKLVADAFMGGTPPGTIRAHRNGMKHDNAVENIIFLTRSESAKRHRPGNSRTVLKVDRDGNVVAIYRSQVEAARKNHISQTAISARCLGKVEDPYRLDGYNYIFEDGKRGRKKHGKA